MSSREDINDRDPLRPVVEGKHLPSYKETEFDNGFIYLFPSLKVSFVDIFSYMITRKREEIMGVQDTDEVQSHRTLDRAAAHFSAGDVQDIRLKQIDEDIIYSTAKVMASMKKLKYIVFICFNKNKAVHGHCNCPIGLAQSCSHIGALLFAFSHYNQEVATEEGGLACTSKLSKWNVPRPMTLQPKPLSDINICRPKTSTSTSNDESCKQRMFDFDPRHSEDRTPDPDFYATKLRELKTVFPKTGMQYISLIPDEPPDHIQTVEIETELCEEERMLELLKFQPGNVFPMEIPQSMIDYVEEHTRDQRDSQLWLELHKGRITSSRFGDVLKSGESPNSLVRDLMHGSSLNQYHRLPPAVQWGVDKEDQARKEYIELMGITGSPITVSRTGLFILSCAPFLGASCDGIVFDKSLPKNVRKGVLEIKCPFSIDGIPVNNMEVTSIIEQYPTFFLEMGIDGPQLKKSHKYYAQVQGEMAVTGLTWCDFVVWTGASQNNVVVQRIHFDHDFVSDMFAKLKSFYFKYLCEI